MRASARLVLFTSFVVAPSLASATVPTVAGTSAADQVQVQFIYSKAFFIDQLVLNNSAITPGALTPCKYETYLGNPVNNCVFDEGFCANPPNTTTMTCLQPFMPGDFTCDCYGQNGFISLGTIGTLAGGAGTATSVALDFQLYVNTTRTAVGGTIPDTIIYDAAPGSPNSVFSPGDTNHAFDHLRVTSLDASGATLLLEWEDGISGGDQDFNDLVAIVRSVPSSCTGSTFCNKQAYTGLDTHFTTHVATQDTTKAGTGFAVTTTLTNYGAATNIGFCQELHIEIPGGTAGETAEGYHYDPTSGTLDCGITMNPAFPFIALSGDGTEVNNPSGGPTCPVGVTRGAANDFVTIGAGSATAPTNLLVSYPQTGNYAYSTYDTYMTQDGNKLVSGSLGPRTQADLRKALYNADTVISPVTTYIYPTSGANAVPPGFHCPSGVNSFYGGQTSGDLYKPLNPKLQTVPDVVAINSPVDIVVPTVPIGFEGPTALIAAYMIFSWSDNLQEVAPGSPNMSGFISTSDINGNPLNGFNNAAEAFYVGGGANKAIKVHLALPTALPEGYQGTLIATLISRATGESLIISTYPMAKDHTPPTISAASTVRTMTGVTATVTASDPVSGLGQAVLSPTINNATLPQDVMTLVSGNFYDATTLTATQPTAQSDVTALDLTVDDTHFNAAPTVRLPVANSGGDRTVECNAFNSANVTLDGSRSTAATDTSVSYAWSGPFGSVSGVTVNETLPYGPSTVTLALSDGRGFTGTETSTINVSDTTPPNLSVSVPESCLWPPNHNLVPYALGSDIPFSVSDVCDPNPTVKIVGVSSTDGEPPLFNATHLCLRSERQGGDSNGNVYTITVQATDVHGNVTTRQVTVTVPHDGGCSGGGSPMFVSDSDPRCQF
jgi:hypothetical protein